MSINSLKDILDLAIKQNTRKMAIAASADLHVLQAVKEAVKIKIIEPIFVGDEILTKEIANKLDFNIDGFELIDEKDPPTAAKIAVKLVKEGKAEILMKGRVSSAPLLKAVLNKEKGLKKRETLSHFALIETSHYHKLLGLTDAGMNINPELKEKINIIENAAEVFHALGVKQPKLAVLGPVEQVNPNISATVDGAILTQMYRRKQITSCIIDGPLAMDNAISKEAAQEKEIDSEVAGDADILLAPDINAGNILYKTMIFLSDASSAAVILGANAPIVLTSRADSEQSKLYSIALAAII